MDPIPQPDPDAELAGGVERGEVVRLLGQPDHLVDRRDPEGVEVAEGRAHGRQSLVPLGARHDRRWVRGVEPQLRSLVEDAGRDAVLVALDPAAGWIRRGRVDPGGGEGCRARRDHVLSDAAQDDGAAAACSVELGAVREPALGERGDGQRVALHPGVGRQAPGAGCHVAQEVADAGGPERGEVDRQAPHEGGPVEVGVAVDEARQKRAPGEVDHAGRRGGEIENRGVTADRQDPPVGDGQRRRVGLASHRRVDPTVVQDELGSPARRALDHGLECSQLRMNCRAFSISWRQLRAGGRPPALALAAAAR